MFEPMLPSSGLDPCFGTEKTAPSVPKSLSDIAGSNSRYNFPCHGYASTTQEDERLRAIVVT